MTKYTTDTLKYFLLVLVFAINIFKHWAKVYFVFSSSFYIFMILLISNDANSSFKYRMQIPI